MTQPHTSPRPLGKMRDLPSCQRWRERKDSYRHLGDNFDPASYAVDGVSKGEARAFVEAHHYSGSFPAARLSVGLYRAWGVLRCLVGVAVLSQDGLGMWCKVTGSESNRTWITLAFHDLENLIQEINQNYVPR